MTSGGARHGKRGWGAAGKGIAFYSIKRNSKVTAMSIEAHNQAAIMREIQEHTLEGALYCTDECQAYATLKMRGEHGLIRKKKGRPVGQDPINGIEGCWSDTQNWRYLYRDVPQKFGPLYLAEVCFHFNHREQDLKPSLHKLLQAMPTHEMKPSLVRFGGRLPLFIEWKGSAT